MKKIAVVLGGCGSRDGSEIHEAVYTLLSIAQLGGSYSCFAPDRNQIDCINHISGQSILAERNLLVEAARITRGEIKELSGLNAADFDALIIPGGLGFAKNFSDYLTKGADMTVDCQLAEIVLSFNRLEKYIGAICIAPIIVAGIFKDSGKQITITTGFGNTKNNQDMAKIGVKVQELASTEIAIDLSNKLVTTPAFMNKTSMPDVYAGINRLVNHIIQNS
jgi:enhancing lycopene biosynthesis protein 2